MEFRLDLRLTDGKEGPPVTGAALEVSRTFRDPALALTSGPDGVARIEFPATPSHLGVRARKDGFVPKVVSFNLKENPTTEFTLEMERSRTIGGLVVNEKGEPVEGATVLLIIRGSSSSHVAPQVYNDIFEAPAVTDAAGRWSFASAPSDLGPLHVRLAHPEYISNKEVRNLPALDQFAAGTAVLTLEKGVPCEGTVTDTNGHPIEDVTVILGEDGADSCATPRRTTDAQGRFRFGSVRVERHGRTPILSFWKDGYAAQLIELRQSSTVIDASAILRTGKSLHLRFTDSTGIPIAGVMMALTFWREHRPAGICEISDASGIAEWKDAPDDPVGMTVMHEAFQRREVRVTADGNIHDIVLQRPTLVVGRVIDSRTKEPIPHFRIVKGRYFPEQHPSWSHWGFHHPRDGRDGTFQVEFHEPAAMMSRQGGPGEVGAHRVRVEAKGYRPGISRPIANEEESVALQFELEPGAATAGTVHDHHGNPVVNAQMVVAGPGNPVVIANGEIAQRDHLHIPVDNQGRYELPPQEEDFPVAIVDLRAGYLLTKCSALAANPDVTLLPWGRLELAASAVASSRYKYHLRSTKRGGDEAQRIRFHHEPSKNADMWIFEFLPAGPAQLHSPGTSNDHGIAIDIENGRTARIDLRSGRRAVVGRMQLPENVQTAEPLVDAHLRSRSSQPPMAEGLSPEARRAMIDAWCATAEGRQAAVNHFDLHFQIASDGRFRVDDVPTGPCQVLAIFFRTFPPADGRPDIAGYVAHDFQLPTGEGDFDLGTLPFHGPEGIHIG